MALSYGTREGILATLETNLKTAGFKQVERQKTEVYSNYKFPLAFVNYSGESRVRVCLDCVRVEASVTIVAYDDAKTGTPSAKLESLIEKVKSGVLADVTQGGNAINTRIASINTDEGFAYPNVVAVFSLVISYLSET